MIVGKLLALATLTFACSSPDDCALNGMCVDSKCQCLSGWAGKACDTLNASTPSPGYHNQTRASWGGNIVFANNTYHLIMAQVVGDHCGLEHYGSNSAIARAEASDPAGPFQFKEYVVTPFAHNPTIQALPNNTGYVIFFIGHRKVLSVCPQECYRPHTHKHSIHARAHTHTHIFISTEAEPAFGSEEPDRLQPRLPASHRACPSAHWPARGCDQDGSSRLHRPWGVYAFVCLVLGKHGVLRIRWGLFLVSRNENLARGRLRSFTAILPDAIGASREVQLLKSEVEL